MRLLERLLFGFAIALFLLGGLILLAELISAVGLWEVTR